MSMFSLTSRINRRQFWIRYALLLVLSFLLVLPGIFSFVLFEDDTSSLALKLIGACMLAALLTATVALLLFYLACLKQRANDISARHATLIFVLALIASVTLGILVFALGLIPGEDRANRFGARA